MQDKINLTPESPRDLFVQIFNELTTIKNNFVRFEKNIKENFTKFEAEITELQRVKVEDHEKRIRAAENQLLQINTVWKVIGGVALILSMVATALTLIQLI